jgi:hypothetical protein
MEFEKVKDIVRVVDCAVDDAHLHNKHCRQAPIWGNDNDDVE